MSVPPLLVEFAVAATVEHAFDVWTRRTRLWWPASHTVSGNPERIVFEPRPGGRIVEVAPTGERHQWGELLDWDPPTRLRFRWHLFFDPSEATEVEITFQAGDGGTVVRLEQRGWDRLGAAGRPRRDRTGQVWSKLAERYTAACSAG